MKTVHRRTVLTLFWPALILLLGHLNPDARAQGPDTIQRTLHNHFTGDHTYTCLVIDGGVVPLIPAGNDTEVRGGNGVTITWPKDNAIAIIRGASRAEAALLNLMGTKDAAAAWTKYMASTLHGPGYTYTVHDFQPDMLDVNHWRIGAITMDFTVGGGKYSSLLMIWRCRDGSTLAVTMQSSPDQFKSHCDDLVAMIGSSLILSPGS
jgi:hypothetical protein